MSVINSWLLVTGEISGVWLLSTLISAFSSLLSGKLSNRWALSTAFNTMEKVKGFGKKVAEAGKTGKSKLDEIRTKDWADPTGAVLKAAANVASLIPPAAGGVIKGALSMGGSGSG